MSPYPTAYQIEEMFSNRARPDKFHQYLADPIDVTVVGQDFHISGNYKSTQEFHDNIYVRIVAALKEESIRIEVRRVIGGGDSAVRKLRSSILATQGGQSSRIISPLNRNSRLLSCYMYAYTRLPVGSCRNLCHSRIQVW